MYSVARALRNICGSGGFDPIVVQVCHKSFVYEYNCTILPDTITYSVVLYFYSTSMNFKY